jgi:hypothetical protein
MGKELDSFGIKHFGIGVCGFMITSDGFSTFSRKGYGCK